MRKLKSKLAALLCLAMLFTEVIPAWAETEVLPSATETVQQEEQPATEEGAVSEETASPSDAEDPITEAESFSEEEPLFEEEPLSEEELTEEEFTLAGASDLAGEASASNAKIPTVMFQTDWGNYTFKMKTLSPGYLEGLNKAVYYEGDGVFRLCKDLEANIHFSFKYEWELKLNGYTLKGVSDYSAVSVKHPGGILVIDGADASGKNGTICHKKGTVADDGAAVFNAGTLTIKNTNIGVSWGTIQSTHNGGAVYNRGTCTLDGVQIRRFQSLGKGGAVYNEGELLVENSGGSSYGLEIHDCESKEEGNGIYNTKDGTITVNAAVSGTKELINCGRITAGDSPAAGQAFYIDVENTDGGTVESGVFAYTLTGVIADFSKVRLLYTVDAEPLLLPCDVPLQAELKKSYPAVAEFILPDDGERKVTAEEVTDRTDRKQRNIKSKGKRITIQFDTRCTDVTVPSQEIVTGTVPTVPKASRAGYKDVEWYKDPALKVKYDFKTPLWDSCTLYAKWIDYERVCVTFNTVCGIKIPSQHVIKGERATKPVDPIQRDYKFEGWELYGSAFDFSQPVETDIVLTAVWSYYPGYWQEAWFSPNNGEAKYVQYFRNYISKPADPVREGYTFLGWSQDSKSFSEPFNFKAVVYDWQGTIYLYAHWKAKKTFTVSFDSQGGTAIEPISVMEGDKAVKPSPDPKKTEESTELVFWGWCLDKECTKLYDFDTPVTGNLTLYAYWEYPQYTPVKITFDSNGGSEVAQQVVKMGTEATEPEEPTKELFLFNGWYADRGLTAKYNFSQPVNTDITLYAAWKPAPPVYVHVTFETLDGKTPQVQTILKGGTATEPAPPVREGYFFLGWYADQSCTKRFDFAAAIEKDTTVYAGWKEKKSFTVTFDSRGGTAVPSQTVWEQETAEKPADPEKTVESITYRFCGWYSDAACRNVYDFNKPVTSNLTLYARWLEPSVTVVHVSYETGGGSSVPEEVVVKGDKASKPEDPVMEMYVFSGWYSDASFKNAYDFGTPVNEDIKLYAKWLMTPVIPVKVTYEYQNGDTPKVETLLTGDVPARPADPERSGYFFLGWFEDQGCTRVWDFAKKVYNDCSIYAGWREKNKYTVTFNSQGGSAVNAQTVAEQDKASKPQDPVKSVEGVKQQFCGWCTDAKCTSKYDFDTPVTGNLTLYAHWLMPSVVTVTVTFDSKGGSSVGDQTVVRGDRAVKPEDPVKDPYVFTGWYTDEECKSKFNFDTVLDDDIELYAGWNLAPVKVVRVRFETGDGTEPEEQIILQYDKPERPADPVRREYFFAGWYADQSCTKRYDFNAPVAEDTVVYAGWTQKQTFKVGFHSMGGSAVATASVLERDPVERPADPTKTVEDVVYRFCGWYTDEACRSVYDFSRPVMKNMTLYAKWLEPSVEIVHVNYDSNGGSSVRPETLIKGDRAQRPDDPVYEHFTFAGWYSDDTLSVQYDFGKAVNEDMTLYAKWLFTPVSIVHATFKLQNDENDVVETVLTGDPVSEPAEPTYENHFFMGWYTSPACTQVWDFRDGIYEDTSIYAGWKAKQIFEVSFDTRGGSEAPQTQEVRELEKASKPADPTKTVESVEYRFCGWCTDAAGKYLYDFNSPVTKSMTLYARWMEPSVVPARVTFDSKGGSEVPVQVLAVPSRAEKPADPVRTGYRFICWLKDGAEYDFTADVTEDITLTAKWLENPVIPVWLIFNTRGGSYIEPQLVASGSTAVRPVHDPEKSGYLFGGWYEDRNCTVRYDFDTVMDRDRVVYAKWNEYAVYTFRFESNGGSAVEDQRIREGSRAVKPEDPVREGYTFMFWCKDAEFSEAYDFNTEVRRDTTVYARWLKNRVTKYKVHFESNGGSAVADQEIASGEKATKPADPVMSGSYRFSGWYSDAPCRIKYDFNTPVTADLTLYAGWIYTGGGGGGGGGGSSGGGGGSVFSGVRSGSDAYDAAGKKIGTWVQDAKGWWIRKLDNSWFRDEWVNCTSNGVLNWYYFNPEGYMYTGFYTDKNGRKFYLNQENGALLGAMATGWVAIAGKWYYFNPVSDGTKGAMFVNRTTPDGHKVGADGAWIP